MLEKLHVHKKRSFNKRLFFIVSVLLIIGILVIMRILDYRQLVKETNTEAITTVQTITASSAPAVETVILPGNVQAWHQATIYARTNGYIKKWYVDIGGKVKKGDILADIESPEVDADFRKAEADLKTAITNNILAQSTAKRWSTLLKSGTVSKQAADEKNSIAKALEAVVVAAYATKDRLHELVGFEQVVAPFDGTISLRHIDIGSLINSGSGLTAQPLFEIVQADLLRVYVHIPQSYSSMIQPDMLVSLRFSEYPGQTFSAKLLETAKAINPKTRTLLAQFVVDNKNGKLLPGSYAEVHFSMPISPHTIILPVNTLLFRAEGLQVATVDKNDQIVLKPIVIHRDLGTNVEIDHGIKPGEKIIINPPDSLIEGEIVRVVNRP